MLLYNQLVDDSTSKGIILRGAMGALFFTMTQLIVLPLEYYMTDGEWQAGCPKIDPVFKRDGLYFHRKTGAVWFEYEGGAWDIGPEGIQDVRFSLQYAHHHERPLRECEYEAMVLLWKNKLLSYDMKLYLYREQHVRALREQKWQLRKDMMHFYKENGID
jgi:hypothetical protein